MWELKTEDEISQELEIVHRPAGAPWDLLLDDVEKEIAARTIDPSWPVDRRYEEYAYHKLSSLGRKI